MVWWLFCACFSCLQRATLIIVFFREIYQQLWYRTRAVSSRHVFQTSTSFQKLWWTSYNMWCKKLFGESVHVKWSTETHFILQFPHLSCRFSAEPEPEALLRELLAILLDHCYVTCNCIRFCSWCNPVFITCLLFIGLSLNSLVQYFIFFFAWLPVCPKMAA